MIVCVCRRVNDKAIAQAARCGMSFDDIKTDMGVATQCGQCESSARAVWMQCRPSQPTAHWVQEPGSPSVRQSPPA